MGWGVPYPDEPPDGVRVYCPVCGMECEEVYVNLNGEVVYCDQCMDKFVWKRDALEWWEDHNG